MAKQRQHKVCISCGKEFPATTEFFHKHTSTKDKLQAECRQCRNIKSREYYHNNIDKYRENGKKWRKENPEKYKKAREAYKERYHEYKLQWKYKISKKDFNLLFESQNGVCAICGKPETRKQKGVLKRLSVDHDHETGEIRGLVCHRCNTLLGMAEDNIEILENAILYLEATSE